MRHGTKTRRGTIPEPTLRCAIRLRERLQETERRMATLERLLDESAEPSTNVRE